MSCSRKRPRIATIGGANGEDRTEEVCDNRGIGAVDEPADVVSNNITVVSSTTADDFSSDLLPNILSYLKLREIMPARCVCKKWTETVRKTAVSPEEECEVNNVKTFNAMRVMSTVLPNLQSVKIEYFRPCNHRYNDGEDPDESYAARTANWTTYDIEILANFRNLRILKVNSAPLNGRYPFLFNSFPLLQKLSISATSLKWDLEMLAGLRMLKELECRYGPHLTGNIRSLRVLKDTLEKVTLGCSSKVEGNFMDLADFSQLKTLKLYSTAVKVDIGDIGSGDFSKLEELWIQELSQHTSNGSSSSVTGNIRSLRVLKDTLQKFTLGDSPDVRGDFMALADFPQLRSLHLDNTAITVDIQDLSTGDFARLKKFVFLSSLASGNISSLRVLKDTLEHVTIRHCRNMEGSFMDLADFPQLRTLDLDDTAVTGDIRDIGKVNFPKIEELFLPSTIYGGIEYELQRISDVTELIRTLYQIKKEHPSLILDAWHGKLSEDSPDWYDQYNMYEDSFSPPFYIRFVEAGTRIGYRWENCADNVKGCEVNWLDPEPDKDRADYRKYIEELQEIEDEVDFYEGLYEPPTQEEYMKLCEELSYR